MNLTRDLASSKASHARGVLFVVPGLLSGVTPLAMISTWRAAALLATCAWAFRRFYHHLFYVLERHLGRERRLAGVWNVIRLLPSEPRAGRDRPGDGRRACHRGGTHGILPP